MTKDTPTDRRRRFEELAGGYERAAKKFVAEGHGDLADFAAELLGITREQVFRMKAKAEQDTKDLLGRTTPPSNNDQNDGSPSPGL